jgi:hypothetical protein
MHRLRATTTLRHLHGLEIMAQPFRSTENFCHVFFSLLEFLMSKINKLLF